MAQAAVVPIGEIHGSIRAGLGVHNPKPTILGGNHRRRIHGAEGGGVGVQAAGLHPVHQCHAGDDIAFVSGEGTAFVDDRRLRESRFISFVCHMLVVAEGVGVDEWAVLAPVLGEAAALRIMHAACVTVIGAGEQPALAVEIDAERVPAAFAEHLEFLRARMISPHGLAEKLDALNLRGTGAAMCAVDPAVRAPTQAVGTGMSVFQTEPREVYLGIAIRNVVAVFVRIKQQVRRHQYPCAAATGDHAAGHVQAVEKGFVFVKDPVAVGVLVDGNLVFPAKMIGRRRRHFVVHGPQILVVLHNLQAGGKRVLEILRHPEPAAFIEIHVERLGYGRFMGDHLHGQAVCEFEFLERLRRRGGLRTVIQCTAALEVFDKRLERIIKFVGRFIRGQKG